MSVEKAFQLQVIYSLGLISPKYMYLKDVCVTES